MTSSIIGIDTTTKQRIEIPKPSRLRGLYIIGAPGTGKSGLIENLIIQDIEQDIGVCLLDPHGDLTYAVLARLPDRRVNDVILLDITNYHYPFGLNLFACSDLTNPRELQQTIDQVMLIFEKLFAVSHDTPLILDYLQNCTHTLIVNPGYTMADIPLLFLNEQCRRKLVANVLDTDVRLFWQQYEDKKPSERSEEASSTLRRVREFLQPLSRAIVGQALSTLDMRFIMDERKILLVKLDPRLEMVTSLVGSVIIALFLNAAYSRAELPLEKRKQFNLYADEFQRFATEDFAILFTEARKFGIALTVAHQMREQLDRQNRSATVNVANLVVFKVSSPDADELKGQFDTTPPPAETRPEYVKTPTHKPVDFIVSGKSHPNEVVNTMLRKWEGVVEQANESIRDIRKSAGTGKWGREEYYFVSNEPRVRQAQDELQTINELLYKVMLEKNPRQVVPIAHVYWMAKRFGLPFFDYKRYDQLQEYLYKKARYPFTWDETIHCEKRFCQGDCGKVVHCDFNSLINFRNGYRSWYRHVLPSPDLADFYPLRDYFSFLLDTYAWGEERKRTEEDIKLYVLLWLVEDNQLDAVLALYEQHIRSLLRRDLLYPVPYFLEEIHYFGDSSPWTKYSHEGRQDFPDPVHINDTESWETREAMGLQKLLGCEWLQLDFAVLQWEKDGIQTQVVTKRDYYQNMGNLLRELPANRNEREFLASLPDVEDTYHKWAWLLKPGQVTSEMIEPFLQAEIDRIIGEQKPAFETLVRQLRDVMQALATQPLEDISGVVEEKPGTTMTYADVANQIANELVKLDQYTARVKIASGVKSVEHIIQTFDPKKESRLGDAALKTRIAAIQAQNIRDGYVTERTQVEEEIRRRQEQCSEPIGSSAVEPPGSRV